MDMKQVPFGGNDLLARMPADVMARLVPHLQLIECEREMKIYDPYEPIEHVIFPASCVASIVAMTETGQSTEIGVVGREGAAGLDVVMGTTSSPHRSMIQIAGEGYRIATKQVAKEFRRSEEFHDHVLHFVHKLAIQISQTTLCNRLHTIDERLPRWLLMSHDRVKRDTLNLTQEFIAMMIGTSRVTVAQAAHKFQDLGYIKYVRGKITILDRDALEDAACDCYRIVKTEYDRKYEAPDLSNGN